MSFLSQPITLQTIFGGTNRMIGPFTVQVIANEETNDTLTITKQPVQTGASITDHAYKEPTVLSMNILQQNNDIISGLLTTFKNPGAGLAQIYQQFLTLQSSRTPFNVITLKRVYQNMLMATIRLTTDRQTENILALNVTMQEVILVSVGSIQIPASQLKNPGANQHRQNVGAKSALLKGTQAIFPSATGVSR